MTDIRIKQSQHLALVCLNGLDFLTLPLGYRVTRLVNTLYLARETNSKLSACSQLRGTIEIGIAITVCAVNRKMCHMI